jgi:hypothetical protein
MLLSQSAKLEHWDIAKLIVACLSQHLNEVALGELQQKVLATLRDSLVLPRIW